MQNSLRQCFLTVRCVFNLPVNSSEMKKSTLHLFCLLALPAPLFRKCMQHADLKMCPLWHHLGRSLMVLFCFLWDHLVATWCLSPPCCRSFSCSCKQRPKTNAVFWRVKEFYRIINRVRISLESGDAKQRRNERNMGPLKWSSDSLCSWLLVYNRIQYFKAPLSPRKHEKYISEPHCCTEWLGPLL